MPAPKPERPVILSVARPPRSQIAVDSRQAVDTTAGHAWRGKPVIEERTAVEGETAEGQRAWRGARRDRERGCHRSRR